MPETLNCKNTLRETKGFRSLKKKKRPILRKCNGYIEEKKVLCVDLLSKFGVSNAKTASRHRSDREGDV